MMKKLSLNAKMIGVLSIFVIACFTISAVGIIKVSEINTSLDYLVNVVVRKAILAKSMDATTNEIKNQEKKFILEESVDGMNQIGKVIDENVDDYFENSKELVKLVTTNKPFVEEAAENMRKWQKVNAEIRKLSLANRNKEAFALVKSESVPLIEAIDKAGQKVTDKASDDMKLETQRTGEIVARTRLLIIVVSSASLLLGCFLAFFILRAVNKAIDQVITSLDESSQQVASAAHQIAATSEELSQATTEQAASLEQTAASVEEMTSMVTKNSESARTTSDTAGQSQQTAARGQETVELMIRSISEINDANTNIMQQIEHSNSQINEIVHVITEIGNKTKVINEIVFQTKLLSFNASVEAARAGEYGKGFAVVAEEVGNLAEMSGNAAKDISTMLDASIKKVEGIVQETSSSVQRLISQGKEKVETGTRVAGDCGNILAEIVKNIDSVTHMATEISAASKEQAQGITEISKAMAQLDQVTQQNSASSEEAASAAEELSAQAETLKAGVVTLIETIRGSNDGAAASTHQPARTASPRMTQTKKAAKSVKASTSDRAPSYHDNRFDAA